MNAKTEKSSLDTFKLLLTVAVLIGGIIGYYHYTEYSTLYRVLGLLGTVILSIIIVMQTTIGRSIWTFAGDSRAEVRKVVWPTRQETIQTTIIIMIVVLITSIFLWGVDSLLGTIVKAITNA